MKNTIKFVLAALDAGVAYIDCDGCLLKKFPVPEHLKGRPVLALLWWTTNLQPTPVIWHRLLLLYLLRLFGVRLILWTNRSAHHRTVTAHALGKHMRLFSECRFLGGAKIKQGLDGPVMDDDEKFLACGRGPGLLVKSL